MSNLFLKIIISTFTMKAKEKTALDIGGGPIGPAIDEQMARDTLERSTDVLRKVTRKVIKRSSRAHANKDFNPDDQISS